MSKRINDRIESAMELGREADKFSDDAFAAGNLARGVYWSRRAIAYYTEAETLSIDLDNPAELHNTLKGVLGE